MIAAVRDTILMRDTHILQGVIALVVAAFITNLALGFFNPGFSGQPIAHNDTLWNFLGMALAGIAFTLAGVAQADKLSLAAREMATLQFLCLGFLWVQHLRTISGLQALLLESGQMHLWQF